MGERREISLTRMQWARPAIVVVILLLLSAMFLLDKGRRERPALDIQRDASGEGGFSFAVIGDYGLDGRSEGRVAELVRALGPDIVITTGDNNYPRGSALTIDPNIGRHYQAFIFPYRGAHGNGAGGVNRFFPSIGNHDWPPEAYMEYFELPGNERYYDFKRGPVHFFALDTNPDEPDGTSAGSAQALWLREGLAASESPFKFVYGHHPPYSSGRHGSSGYMRWPFREWGADAFFAGHDHTYERLSVEGMPYFVIGLGGRSIYPFGRVLPGSAFRYNADYGALLVTVKDSSAVFRFYNIKGVLVDEFEIVK